MRAASHVAHMTVVMYKLENLNGRDHSGRLGVDVSQYYN